MNDLFDREQKILDNALKHLTEIQNGAPCSAVEFDCIVKEYSRLLRQLRRVIKISDKTTVELNTSKLDLLTKVHYDVLTGIYNRRFMEESLRRVIKALSRSSPSKLSVLIIDVDFFKNYNDTYGHSKGDECLKTIATTLKNSITRPEDFVARYGGEEFVVVLPNTDEKGARNIANKIVENVRLCNMPHEKSVAASYVTVSVGATTGTVKHTQSGGDYIRQADEALYISKQNGRNKYTFISFEEEAS